MVKPIDIQKVSDSWKIIKYL